MFFRVHVCGAFGSEDALSSSASGDARAVLECGRHFKQTRFIGNGATCMDWLAEASLLTVSKDPKFKVLRRRRPVIILVHKLSTVVQRMRDDDDSNGLLFVTFERTFNLLKNNLGNDSSFKAPGCGVSSALFVCRTWDFSVRQ